MSWKMSQQQLQLTKVTYAPVYRKAYWITFETSIEISGSIHGIDQLQRRAASHMA